MSILYIVRHGETEWNKENRLQGRRNAPLTDDGKRQVESLRERLKNEDIDIAYTSPLGRTKRTAEIILEEREIPLIEEERIKEIDMGRWEGEKASEVEEKFPDLFHDFWNRPHLYEPESGESFYDVKERVNSFLDEVLTKHENENVLIVSHGCASKVMMTQLQGRPLEKLWDPPKLKEGCLNIVNCGEDDPEIVLFGDTSFHR